MARADVLVGVNIEPTQAKFLDSTYVDPNEYEAVAGAGTVQGDAAALSDAKRFHTVTGANGVVGVRLPNTTKVGTVHTIQSTAAGVLKIYPHTGGTINGAAANAALSSITGPLTLIARNTGTNIWTIA
jgi:hypothetical protein